MPRRGPQPWPRARQPRVGRERGSRVGVPGTEVLMHSSDNGQEGRWAALPLIGGSSVMNTLRERIARVAVTDFMVLVEGESGAGKELVAR